MLRLLRIMPSHLIFLESLGLDQKARTYLELLLMKFHYRLYILQTMLS